MERYNACLVTQGYSQRPGINYEETFSPVVRFESVCSVMALAVRGNMKLHQMDVKTRRQRKLCMPVEEEYIWIKAVSTMLEHCH